MADTYTDSGMTLPGLSVSDVWGDRVNDGVTEIASAMIGGKKTIAIGSSTSYTLAAQVNGVLGDSHYYSLTITGTPASAVTFTIPSSVTRRNYQIKNSTGKTVTVKYAASTGVVLGNGDTTIVWCDGSEVYDRGPGHRITPAETDAGVTPVNYAIPSGYAIGLVNVMRYVPAGTGADGTYDFTTAINNAIAVVTPLGGSVFLPAGQYKTTTEITLPYGVMLYGAGRIRGMDANREGVTSLLGVHTGRSVLSLQGAIGASLRDFSIETHAGAVPKCALLLGRSSAASAGIHNISGISIYGYYSVCPYYSIASEDNTINDLFIWLFGGGAKYCTYTSQSDKLSVGGGLVTSSNLDNRFNHACLINSSRDDDAACVYIDAEGATGSVTYRDGYFHEHSGAYVQIHSSISDGLGPFTFDNCSGEIYANGNPRWGYRLSCSGTRTLPGLTIIGGQRFALYAGDADGAATLNTLVGGSGYTNGTYGTTSSPIALTGGTGTGAQAIVTISGGAVTQVDLVRCGDGYAVNDTLSVLAANVGGTGAGFSIKVAAIGIYQIQQDANLTLESPNIHIQPPEAFPYALCSVVRSKIKSGNVIVGRFAEWSGTLAGAWVNAYGAPAVQFGYALDGFGRVKMRGTIQAGAGTITTLPADYRPATNIRFTLINAAGTAVRILITAATGVMSLAAGANTEMDLSDIEFDLS